MKNGRMNIFNAAMLLFFAQLMLINSPANAFIYWTNANGSADHFDWANGGSDNGLFGSPVIVAGSGFKFFPSNFRAESVNGIADITADRLEFDLHAHENYVITGLHITEYGDYGILGTGSVSASGTMFLSNLNEFDVLFDDLVTDPLSPISGPDDANSWTGQVCVSSFEWTDFKVILDNNLMAVSGPNSTAFIEKKVLEGAVSIELIVEQIPEPATISFVSVGILAIIRKKFR